MHRHSESHNLDINISLSTSPKYSDLNQCNKNVSILSGYDKLHFMIYIIWIINRRKMIKSLMN